VAAPRLILLRQADLAQTVNVAAVHVAQKGADQVERQAVAAELACGLA
jgi:hypothetical protein